MSATSDLLNVVMAAAAAPLAGLAGVALWRLAGVLHLQGTAQDKANMEAEIQAAIGAGTAFVAREAPQVLSGGITSAKLLDDVAAAATAYFRARFPDRAAQIAGAVTSDASTVGVFAAVQQTIAARLPNINSVAAPTPAPGPAASAPAG